MKVVLEADDIGDAIVELLQRRGISVSRHQVSLAAHHDDVTKQWEFNAVVRDVELPHTEGPYR